MADVAQEEVTQTPPPEPPAGEAIPAAKKPWLRNFIRTALVKTGSGIVGAAGLAGIAAAFTLPLWPAIGLATLGLAAAATGTYGLVTDKARGWINRKADISWKFTKELYSDHTFWVKALAVKGGASAIVVAGLAAISVAVNMPLILGIGGVALGTGIVVAGLYGMVAGGVKAWEGLKDIYARATGKEPGGHAYKERKDLLERLENTRLARKIAGTKLAKKIANTYAWKTAKKLSRRGEDSLLGGIAVGGAALSLALFVVALPVIAAGSLLTFTAIMGLSSLASAVTGFYFSITGIKEENRLKREHDEKKKKLKENQKKFWQPGKFLHWGKVENEPAPQIGDDAPFSPIGHPFVPPQPAEKPKVAEAQPLAGSFDPAATGKEPPAPPPPKIPDSPRPSQ